MLLPRLHLPAARTAAAAAASALFGGSAATTMGAANKNCRRAAKAVSVLLAMSWIVWNNVLRPLGYGRKGSGARPAATAATTTTKAAAVVLLPSAVGGVGQPAVAVATNKAKESDDDSTEEAASVSHGGSSTWDDEAFCSRFPTALARGRSNGNEVVDLNSARHRLKLASTPKAGATVATQVMMRYLGLYEEATAYHRWIHKYRSHVFTKDPEHETVSCQTHCRKK